MGRHQLCVDSGTVAVCSQEALGATKLKELFSPGLHVSNLYGSNNTSRSLYIGQNTSLSDDDAFRMIMTVGRSEVERANIL